MVYVFRDESGSRVEQGWIEGGKLLPEGQLYEGYCNGSD